jgi:hypothetical protein
LYIAQGYSRVERGGNVSYLSGWGVTVLPDPGAARGAADYPSGAMPVQPLAVGGQEYRPVSALADGQVDRPGGARRQRDGDDLARPCR